MIAMWIPRLAAVALLTSCVAVPEAELRLYTDTFEEARAANETLYRELDDAVSAAQAITEEAPGAKQDCRVEAASPPDCFDPIDALPKAPKPLEPSIAARVVAFDAVAAYNEALVALASGATAEALVARIDRMVESARSVASLAGPAVAGPMAAAQLLFDALRPLGEELERARSNATARAAILDNSSLVDHLIELLMADTVPAYNLYSAARTVTANEIEGAPLSAEFKAEIDRIADFHRALSANAKLLHEARESQRGLIAAIRAGDTPAAQLDAAIEQTLRIRDAAINLRAAAEAAANPAS